MLIIRDRQLQVFREVALSECRKRLAGHLRRTFPRDTRLLGSVQVERVVLLGITRAAQYGHETEREMFLYLTLILMLGASFDEDPQLPWAAARLADSSNPNPPARLDELHEFAGTYLDRVAGENNEHLIQALLRIRDFDPGSMASVPSANLEDEVVTALARLYPQKFAYQGEFPTRSATRHGAALAKHYGFSGGRAVCLFAGLAFMLGWGFDHDPQFPWVAEALGTAGEAAGLDRLHGSAMKYLEQGLK